MNHQKIINLLKISIKNFKDIGDYQMISIIGSYNKREENNSDLDLVTIGVSETHKRFKKYLKGLLLKEGIEVSFFKTILNKYKIKKNPLLIHDLHYNSSEQLLKKEWKSVINAIKEESLILYGKNPLKDLPLQNVDQKSFFNNYLRWARNIKGESDFKIFNEFIIHIEFVFRKYSFDSEFDRIKAIFDLDIEWRKKLNQIIEELDSFSRDTR